MSPQGYPRSQHRQLRRMAPTLASDVALLARGAILWDDHDDLEDDDPGPRPWWCHVAAPAPEGDPLPGVSMEGT